MKASPGPAVVQEIQPCRNWVKRVSPPPYHDEEGGGSA